jgi:hypothetical protein
MIFYLVSMTLLLSFISYCAYRIYKGAIRLHGLIEWIAGALVASFTLEGLWNLWRLIVRISNAPWGYAEDVFWVMTAVGVLFGVVLTRELLRQTPKQESTQTLPAKASKPKKSKKPN